MLLNIQFEKPWESPNSSLRCEHLCFAWSPAFSRLRPGYTKIVPVPCTRSALVHFLSPFPPSCRPLPVYLPSVFQEAVRRSCRWEALCVPPTMSLFSRLSAPHSDTHHVTYDTVNNWVSCLASPPARKLLRAAAWSPFIFQVPRTVPGS